MDSPIDFHPHQRKALLYHADSRSLVLLADDSMGLVVTSPPYWHIKDYGTPGQIGFGQSLHEYLYDLARVWRECHRVLMPGRRLCVNVGDQFARALVYGRYQVIPPHAEVIGQALACGFDYLGSIIWQKRTTMKPSGGAVIMGSFPHPPNGIVELDYEFILIFRKPGESPRPDEDARKKSALTKEEWKEYFSGHWTFAGQRQQGHEAMFPEELPARLIRMFSFVHEPILDPFAGSGTTLRAAMHWQRQGVGFEINEEFLPLIRSKCGAEEESLLPSSLDIIARTKPTRPAPAPPAYRPTAPDARSVADAPEPEAEPLYRVDQVVDELTLGINDGRRVRLLGLTVTQQRRADAQQYLETYLRGKRISLRFDGEMQSDAAYVYLSNRLFVNRKMIEMGLARADAAPHSLREKFLRAEAKA